MAKILRISYENHEAQFPQSNVFTISKTKCFCWPKIDVSSLLNSKCLKVEFRFNCTRYTKEVLLLLLLLVVVVVSSQLYATLTERCMIVF